VVAGGDDERLETGDERRADDGTRESQTRGVGGCGLVAADGLSCGSEELGLGERLTT
jgi:hypothetical protein